MAEREELFMNIKQAHDLLDGVALLECLGNLYEYIGTEQSKHIFQSVNDDHIIKTSFENLISMPEYNIQY